MSSPSRLTEQKGNIGHEEVRISADQCLALERSVEKLKSQNESLSATNKALNEQIAELQKQLKERPVNHEEGPAELLRVLRGFQRLPEDYTPVPDEAAAANVARLVENLNEQIDQTVASIVMDAIQKESPNKEETEEARAFITLWMGEKILDFLEDGARERATASVHLRVGLRASLVYECGWIVNEFDLSDGIKNSRLKNMYLGLLNQKDTSLLTTARWRSILKQSIRDVRHEFDETGRPKVMEHTLIRLRNIMVVMGCSRQSAKVCLEAYEERIAHCVKAALEVETAVDRVISPILNVTWLLYNRVIGDESEGEEVDRHMNPVHLPTGSTALCSVALGLESWDYEPAINAIECHVRIKTKYISFLSARSTETRVIENKVPGQPVARTSNSDKVSRASSNPVADDGPSLGSDPIDDDD